MKIIDAHAHVIERISGFGPKGELRPLGKGRARWANGDEIDLIPEALGNYAFTGEALLSLMDSFHVEKSVLMQGSFYGFQNEYTLEMTKQYPDRFVGTGTFDPYCIHKDQLMDRLLNDMKFRVLKFEASSGGGLMGYHDAFPIDGPVFQDIFTTVAQRGVTLVLDIGSPGMESFQVEAVKNAAKKHPDMKIVICHLLAPRKNEKNVLTDSLKALNLENIWFDLAAVPWNLEPEPYDTAREYLDAAKHIVGTEKLIWGTDVPSVLTKESYRDLIGYITEADIFSSSELEAVFYNNACTAYPIGE